MHAVGTVRVRLRGEGTCGLCVNHKGRAELLSWLSGGWAKLSISLDVMSYLSDTVLWDALL